MDSQGYHYPRPSCARNADVASRDPLARPLLFTSRNLPLSATASLVQPPPTNAPVGTYAAGAGAKESCRRYFPLRFGPTSGPFSYRHTPNSTPAHSSHAEYSPLHNSPRPCWKCSTVIEPPARPGCAPTGVTAPAPGQASAPPDQCFFVTVPGTHKISKGHEAHAAAAVAAARICACPEMVECTTARAAVASTPERIVAVPVSSSRNPTADATCPVPEYIQADIRGHSPQSPSIKYRVQCRLFATGGQRHHFLVTAEPIQVIPNCSNPSALSSVAGSAYETERLPFSSTGRGQSAVGVKKTAGNRLHVEQLGNHRLLERQGNPETLSTTSSLNRPVSDSSCNDDEVVPEEGEEANILRVLQQNYLHVAEKQRNLHECTTVQAQLVSWVPHTERKEQIQKQDARFTASWTTSSPTGSVSDSSCASLGDSSQQDPRVAASAAALLPDAKYPDVTSSTPWPSPPRNPFNAVRDSTVASAAPRSVSLHCTAPCVKSSPRVLSNTRAMEQAAHFEVRTCSDATDSAVDPSACPLDSTFALSSDTVAATKINRRGLHACRPPPLDPKLLPDAVEVLPEVFTPSCKNTSAPCFTYPYSAPRCSSLVTGTPTCHPINQSQVSVNSSRGESTGSHEQQDLSRYSLVLAAPHSIQPHHDQHFSNDNITSNVASPGCSAGTETRILALTPTRKRTWIAASLKSLVDKLETRNESSRCSDTCGTSEELDVIPREGEKQRQKKRRVEGTTMCLQNLGDAIYLHVTAADVTYTWSLPRTPHNTGATNKAIRTVSGINRKCVEVLGNAAMRGTQTLVQRCTLPSFSHKHACKTEHVHSGISHDTRALEVTWASQQSPSCVAPESTSSHPTPFVTALFASVWDSHADSGGGTNGARHEQNPKIGLHRHENLRENTSTGRANKVYKCTACESSARQDTGCRRRESLQDDKEENGEVPWQNSCSSQCHPLAAEQKEPVSTPTSSIHFSTLSAACCLALKGACSESGGGDAVLATSNERRLSAKEYGEILRGTLETTAPAADPPCINSLTNNNPPHGCEAARVTVDAIAQGEGHNKEKGCEARRFSLSASTPASTAVSAVGPRKYVVAPPGCFIERRTRSAALDAGGRPIRISRPLRHYLTMLATHQNSKQRHGVSPVTPCCSGTCISVLGEDVQEHNHKHGDLTSPIHPTDAAGSAELSASATTRMYCVAPPGCYINTATKGAALDASGRPVRVGTALKPCVDKTKKRTNDSTKCISATLLKQCCSETPTSIQETEAQGQKMEPVPVVRTSVQGVVTSVSRTSVAGELTRHNIVTPLEWLRGAQPKGPAEFTHLSMSQETDHVRRTRRASVARRCHSVKDCPGCSVELQREKTGRVIRVNLPQRSADLQSLSRAPVTSTLSYRYRVARSSTRPSGTEIGTRVYRSQERETVEGVSRDAVALPEDSAAVHAGCLGCVQREESGDSIQAYLSQKTADRPSRARVAAICTASQCQAEACRGRSRNGRRRGKVNIVHTCGAKDRDAVESVFRAGVPLRGNVSVAAPSCLTCAQIESGGSAKVIAAQEPTAGTVPQHHTMTPCGHSGTPRRLGMEDVLQTRRPQEGHGAGDTDASPVALRGDLCSAPPLCLEVPQPESGKPVQKDLSHEAPDGSTLSGFASSADSPQDHAVVSPVGSTSPRRIGFRMWIKMFEAPEGYDVEAALRYAARSRYGTASHPHACATPTPSRSCRYYQENQCRKIPDAPALSEAAAIEDHPGDFPVASPVGSMSPRRIGFKKWIKMFETPEGYDVEAALQYAARRRYGTASHTHCCVTSTPSHTCRYGHDDQGHEAPYGSGVAGSPAPGAVIQCHVSSHRVHAGTACQQGAEQQFRRCGTKRRPLVVVARRAVVASRIYPVRFRKFRAPILASGNSS